MAISVSAWRYNLKGVFEAGTHDFWSLNVALIPLIRTIVIYRYIESEIDMR
jgi:hypothetical protein